LLQEIKFSNQIEEKKMSNRKEAQRIKSLDKNFELSKEIKKRKRKKNGDQKLKKRAIFFILIDFHCNFFQFTYCKKLHKHHSQAYLIIIIITKLNESTQKSLMNILTHLYFTYSFSD